MKAACVISAGVIACAAAGQTAAAPSGVQLQVTETAVDLSRPAAVQLHVRLVNGSGQVLQIWPGAGSLLTVGSEGTETPCADPPNTTANPESAPRALRPGDSDTETLTLNVDVCNGLRRAKTVRVQRTVLALNGDPVRFESQPVPVQNGGSPADGEAAAIKAMLTKQADDWNRGDMDAFASGYKNSADILFIGGTISRGYDGMLARYKHAYPTREAMGTLTFSALEIQPLDAKFATVTGRFHLERTAAGGGNANGFFLLVAEDTADGWKIVRDDTTALPPPAKP